MATVIENFEGKLHPAIKLGLGMAVAQEIGTTSHVLKVHVPGSGDPDILETRDLVFSTTGTWPDCRVRFRAKDLRSPTSWPGIVFSIAGGKEQVGIGLRSRGDYTSLSIGRRVPIVLRDDPPAAGWHTYEASLFVDEQQSTPFGMRKWRTLQFKVDGHTLLSHEIDTGITPKLMKLAGNISTVILSSNPGEVDMEWDDIAFSSGLGHAHAGNSVPNMRLQVNDVSASVLSGIMVTLMDLVPWGDIGIRRAVIENPSTLEEPRLVYNRNKHISTVDLQLLKARLRQFKAPLIICHLSAPSLLGSVPYALAQRLSANSIAVELVGRPDTKSLFDLWESTYRDGPAPAICFWF